MILLRTWAGIARHWESRRFEWAMGASAFAMGLALTLQPDAFERSPHYIILEGIADEGFYALLFFLTAIGRLIALGVNGSFPATFRRAPHLRAASALLGGLLWASLSYGFFLAALEYGTAYPPIVVYGTAAMIELGNVRTASTAVGQWARGRG